MSKQTFSIFQIFALYFPFFMTPHNARSSVTLERLGIVVREPQSHLELTYFLPSLIAFTLQIYNWASMHLKFWGDSTNQYSIRNKAKLCVKAQRFWHFSSFLEGLGVFDLVFLSHFLTKSICSCAHWKGNFLNFL